MIGCSWKSSADQSMLVWELTLYKRKFLCIKLHSELTFDDLQNAQSMQKATAMDEATPHGAINEDEAHLHAQRLNKVMDSMANRIKEGEADAMRWATADCKTAITTVMPGMEDADPAVMLATVRDPSCLAICPGTEENQ